MSELRTSSAARCGHVRASAGKIDGKRKDGLPGLVDSCTIVADAPINASQVLSALLKAHVLTEDHGITAEQEQ